MMMWLKLIPLRQWFFAGLFVAAAALALYEHHHLIAEGKAEELATLKTSSDSLIKQANADIAKLNKDHAAAVTAILGAWENEHKADTDRAAGDAERLRGFDAYRHAHPAVASAGGGSQSQSSGDGGASGTDSLLGLMEQSALGLAAANRDAKSALILCTKERDELTGKPTP